MQESAPLLALVAKFAHTHCRFAAPAVSVYCSAKVWLSPDPEFGVTETAAGWPEPVTVQFPSCFHPVLAPDKSPAYRYTFFAPAYPALNVSAAFTVSVLPLGVTVVADTLSEHWLFCSVVAAPGVAANQADPASFNRFTWLAAGL